MMNDLPKSIPILCVDFDGVIHSYTSGWKGARCIPDPPVEGALDFLIEASKTFDVQIYSSRSRYLFGRRAIKKWLMRHYQDKMLREDVQKENPILYSHVCENAFADPWIDEVIWASKRFVNTFKYPTKKPPAFLQIDDRAITFTGKFPPIEQLISFKPWNKGN